MGLPSIFEVFQLAIGPSTVFTTGALRIGQAFREVLLSSPYRPPNRILIELSGNFAKSGRENNSDQAVITGLGGYKLEETGILLKAFFAKIKENGSFPFFGDVWPFNPESDLIFKFADAGPENPDMIRFHVISQAGQPLYHAEYFPVGNGLIKGTGIVDPINFVIENAPENFKDIQGIIKSRKLSLTEYVIDSECKRHQISVDHFHKRMLVTWKIMITNIDRGLKSSGNPGDLPGGFAENMNRKFLNHSAGSAVFGGDNMRGAIYAVALSEEILKNRQVITAPTCTGSALVPAILRLMQEKFLFSDEKIIEGLIISGLYGSILLNRLNRSGTSQDMHIEVACSAAMAAAGATYLMGGSLEETEKAAVMGTLLNRGPGLKETHLDPKSFILLNSMLAQSIPPLVDLARVQDESIVPTFDEALNTLFDN